MKKLLLAVAVAFMITSCTNQPSNGGGDAGAVTIIEVRLQRVDSGNAYWYKAYAAKGEWPGQEMWFIDTIGKYDVGDVLNK